MSQENVEVVKAAFEAYNRGDHPVERLRIARSPCLQAGCDVLPKA